MLRENVSVVPGGLMLGGLRVFIGHSHAHVRAGLRRLLVEDGKVAAIAEAGSLEDALTVLKERGWQLVVMGSTFAGPSIREQLAMFRQVEPAIQCVLLSSHPHEGINALLIECGADAVVMEDRIDEDLIPAIQGLRRGECVFRRGIQEDSARLAADPEGKSPVSALSSTDLPAGTFPFARRKSSSSR